VDEHSPDSRPTLELRKLRLEVERLELDVASATRLRRFDLLLRLLPTLTILVTVLGFVFSVWQYRVQQVRNREAAKLQADKDSQERAELARREAENAQRAFMKPLLEKQQQLYFEASAAAATIATSADPSERRKAEAQFWVLYWGPLVMVESQDVSGAMKKFGRCVSREERCSSEEIKRRSLALASTLEGSMLKTWNANPESFRTGQFDYR
jgi:hypothetical protein